MKKTILALAISSVSFGAMATTVTAPVPSDLANKAKLNTVQQMLVDNGLTIVVDNGTDAFGDSTTTNGTVTITTAKGEVVVSENGSWVYTDKDSLDHNGTDNSASGTKNQHGHRDVMNGEETDYARIAAQQVVVDHVTTILKDGDSTTQLNDESQSAIANHIRANGLQSEVKRVAAEHLKDDSQTYAMDRIKQATPADTVLAANAILSHVTGQEVIVDNSGAEPVITVGGEQVTEQQLHEMRTKLYEAVNGSNETPVDGDLPPILEDGSPIVDPIQGDQPVPSEGQKIVEGLQKKAEELQLEHNGEEAQRYATVAEIYNAGQDAKIAKNEQDIATLFGEVDRLDEKMDGVMAGVHAVNNARPYLSSEGDTAIGAGVGYAGDAGAVAFGAAHAFTDSLSASMTLNVTTGSYSEVSGGAGVQYKF